ncbi:MAG TPA: lysylphosphatidylglycerol synthase domain-containing protein, partial [Gemmatimonadaceae bacterium]|nr:lysylphosphatidylglycerol synthase domain-containing protein [Gemmatimonadaceae bacterium]
LPPSVRPAAVVILAATIAFIAAFAFAAITGIGLIVPIVRASRFLIGTRYAERVAHDLSPVEDVLVTFLHAYPKRLAEVFTMEIAAHTLLIVEIWIVVAALGYRLSWRDPLIVEGGVKFIAIAFSFIPGQFGASEGVYALLAGAIGLPTAAGLTVALMRRVRGLLVAAAGVVALTLIRDR